MNEIVYTIQDLKTDDVVAVIDNDLDLLRFLYSQAHNYPQVEGNEKTIDEMYHDLRTHAIEVQDLKYHFWGIDIGVHCINYDYGRDNHYHGRKIEDVAAEAGIKITEED